MKKEYKKWHRIKSKIEEGALNDITVKAGDVWWGSIGLNIGSEVDGKNRMFERPLLVTEVLDLGLITVAPLTSKLKTLPDRYQVSVNGLASDVLLIQERTISIKRLQRKMGEISKQDLINIIDLKITKLNNAKPRHK